MPIRKHRNDQATGPGTSDADSSGENIPDGQSLPEDSAESDLEKLGRETERGLDRALNRIPPG